MNRHGAVELPFAGRLRTFRLALDEIEELEAACAVSAFAVLRGLVTRGEAFRLRQVVEVVRLGLIGGGMAAWRAATLARDVVTARAPDAAVGLALAILVSALARVHGGDSDGVADRGGPSGAGPERLDFAVIRGNAVMMNIQDVGALSLGQWSAIARQWNKAHGKGSDPSNAPSDDEFDAAVLAARGVFPGD